MDYEIVTQMSIPPALRVKSSPLPGRMRFSTLSENHTPLLPPLPAPIPEAFGGVEVITHGLRLDILQRGCVPFDDISERFRGICFFSKHPISLVNIHIHLLTFLYERLLNWISLLDGFRCLAPKPLVVHFLFNYY